MSLLEPTPEQFAARAARPADAAVVMVNLLKFNQPGGLERYLQYGQEVAPHLERVGGKSVTAEPRRLSSSAMASGRGGTRSSSSNIRLPPRSSRW